MEISFQEGDLVIVNEVGENGWWRGSLASGLSGWFPGSHVVVSLFHCQLSSFALSVFALQLSAVITIWCQIVPVCAFHDVYLHLYAMHFRSSVSACTLSCVCVHSRWLSLRFIEWCFTTACIHSCSVAFPFTFSMPFADVSTVLGPAVITHSCLDPLSSFRAL